MIVIITKKFMINLFLQVGHTIKDDISLICKTIELNKITVKSVIDISNIYRKISK